MPPWLVVVIGFLVLLVLVVLVLELAGRRRVVTPGLDPDRLEVFVRHLLDVLTDQSQLVVQREEGEDRLRLVKHVKTDSVDRMKKGHVISSNPGLIGARSARLSRRQANR